MFNRLLIAAVMATSLTGAAMAQTDMACDQAGMTKLETDVNSITDATKKEMATKELAMAKEAMAAKDTAKCKTHMDNAMKGKDAM
ncbi:hypothetical protein [Ensifer sp. SSB1]|jgi:hypothetical protein|uniref:hypothetical protein n=1 Tax=Ensifer sp. SSB1 TaxID=2795385 RepID=UPI001A5C639E|nr:hypothetical protein [Ensifer sp. SSB1]MBK5566077.1 hypothetical protein [Ensifer sp. SSB1]